MKIWQLMPHQDQLLNWSLYKKFKSSTQTISYQRKRESRLEHNFVWGKPDIKLINNKLKSFTFFFFWWVRLFIKHKPFKMFLIVPMGLLHIDFNPNSLTLVSSAIYEWQKAKLSFIQRTINDSRLSSNKKKFLCM